MITLENGPLRLDLHPLGARMSRLTYQGKDMILPCPEDIDPLTDWGYVGAVIGPVMNRVTLTDDVSEWLGPKGGVLLHGGDAGLHAQHWDIADQGLTHATFSLSRRSGEDGFAGHRQFTARYTLTDAATLEIELTARTDTRTLLGITSHPYWTLGLPAPLTGATLEVAAGEILPIDEKTCPTGEVLSVEGTPFDFRTPRQLVPGSPPLDHNFCLAHGRRNQPTFAAKVQAENGFSLAIATTEPGLQVYDGRTTDAYDVPRYAGLALEPQMWPDAPRHAHFPSVRVSAGGTITALSRFTLDRRTA